MEQEKKNLQVVVAGLNNDNNEKPSSAKSNKKSKKLKVSKF